MAYGATDLPTSHLYISSQFSIKPNPETENWTEECSFLKTEVPAAALEWFLISLFSVYQNFEIYVKNNNNNKNI